MATKKINFNEINKNKAATSTLSEALKNNDNNIEHTVKPQKTTFEKIPPQEIRTDPKNEFNTLYPLNLDTVHTLAGRMEDKGYDDSQCIHTARFNDEEETGEICIDGHHRRQAAIEAEIERVPVYRHVFETRQEGLIYALELQLIRRNVDKGDLYKDFLKLKKLKEAYRGISGDEPVEKESGKQAERDAKKLGTSTRQVEKMNAIEKSDREDIKEALENGDITVNAAYDELKGKKTKKQKNDDIPSDALEDNSEEPKGIVVTDHSDHKERPNIKATAPVPGNESDLLINAKNEAYHEGLSKGIEIAEKVFIFALAEISKGRSIKEVYFDERIAFDVQTMQNFVLPDDDEHILEEL